LKKTHLITLTLLASLSSLYVGCGNKQDSNVSGLNFPTSGPDPLAPYLWHLKNITIPYVNNSSAQNSTHINLADVHSSYTGSGVKIIVSDGQIDLSHPELTKNANLSLSKNYSLSGSYFGNPFDNDDFDAHGTGVFSLAGGTKNNGVGGFGVAPDATLIGYNFLNSSPMESKFLDQLTVQNGNGIFNYSYGPMNCQFESLLGDNELFINNLRYQSISKNNIYVVAAGNEYRVSTNSCSGSNTPYYGNANFDQDRVYPYFILVGATNADGESAGYSTPGANIWISAPGGDLSSDSEIGLMVADIIGCDKGYSADSFTNFDLENSSENPYCSFFSEAAGTSYAAPIVTGAIAVLKEVNPSLSWRDFKHILASTASRIDVNASQDNHPNSENLTGHKYQQEWIQNNAGYFFHPWYGFGLLDLTAAVMMAQNPNFNLYELKSTDNFLDEPSYTSNSNLNLSIPNNSLGTSNTINVDSHDLVIEHVLITVDVTHLSPSDIGIELYSPEGTMTKVMNINSHIAGTNLDSVKFGLNAFYGERSQGDWTIKIVDGKAGVNGTLNNWSISILGNKGDPSLTDTIEPSPAENFIHSNGVLSWTAPGGVTDISRYEICIYETSKAESSCKDADWRPIVNGSTNLTLSGYVSGGLRIDSFISGTNYTAKIRVIDEAENESTEVTTSWTP